MSDRGEGLGALVTGAALRRGLPPLAALICGEVAGFGGDYFRNDRKLQAAIAEKTGWTYHRESIGRSRRQLSSRWEVARGTRIRTGQFPSPAAKRPSSHGCSRTELIWKALGLKTPGRAVRRRERDRAQARAREAIAAPPPKANPAGVDPRPGPKYSTPAPNTHSAPTSPTPVDPVLAGLFSKIGRRIEAREDAAAVLAAERARKPRPPPDTS